VRRGGDNLRYISSRLLSRPAWVYCVARAEIRMGMDAGDCEVARDLVAKKKKPGTAGLFDEYLFRSVHFASLAI
jgi:hypothetical protein